DREKAGVVRIGAGHRLRPRHHSPGWTEVLQSVPGSLAGRTAPVAASGEPSAGPRQGGGDWGRWTGRSTSGGAVASLGTGRQWIVGRETGATSGGVHTHAGRPPSSCLRPSFNYGT